MENPLRNPLETLAENLRKPYVYVVFWFSIYGLAMALVLWRPLQGFARALLRPSKGFWRALGPKPYSGL